jgi:hypothetical protein
MYFGILFVLVAILVVSLPAVIVLEGLVLAGMLRQPVGRSMGLAARANLQSLLWCIGLGLIDLVFASGHVNTQPTFIPALVMLVPLFALLWWIEHRALASRLTEVASRQLAQATGVANLASYVLIVAAVFALYPRHSPTAARVQISEARGQASSARHAVDEYWEAHKQFPRDARALRLEPPAEPYHVELRQGGVIAVRIIKAQHPDLQDRHVFMQPDVQADGNLAWRCSSPDIPPRLLPASCR